MGCMAVNDCFHFSLNLMTKIRMDSIHSKQILLQLCRHVCKQLFTSEICLKVKFQTILLCHEIYSQ